jgi:hypothetical protein
MRIRVNEALMFDDIILNNIMDDNAFQLTREEICVYVSR